MRVWRHKNTAYTQRNIQPTVPYGGGLVIIRHVFKFQPRRAKHHGKRDRRCRSASSGRLMILIDLSPADLRRFLTVLVDKRLLGSQCCLSTGLVANGIRLTKCVLKKLFILSKHGTEANIRSTKMANNPHAYNRDVLQSYWTSEWATTTVVSRLVRKHIQTNNVKDCGLFAIFVLLIFAFVPCLLRMNKFFKTPDLNTQIRSVNILNFE
jgi:hypothetical protein